MGEGKRVIYFQAYYCVLLTNRVKKHPSVPKKHKIRQFAYKNTFNEAILTSDQKEEKKIF